MMLNVMGEFGRFQTGASPVRVKHDV